MIGKKEFVATGLNPDEEIFVTHVAALSFNPDIYLSYRAQLISFPTNNAPTAISSKYADFVDILFLESEAKLSEYTKINDHSIDLFDSQ